jgi:two-component system OmpR family sensor kinase
MTGADAAGPGRPRGGLARVRSLPARLAAGTPLRVRLVLALLVLVALAITVIGVAGTQALRTYLLDRVDTQLVDSTREFPGRPGPFGRPRLPGNRDEGFWPAPAGGFFLAITDAAGVGGGLQTPRESAQTAPRLPVLTAAEVAERAGKPFTVPAVGAGADWRVLVTALPDGAGAVTVASSLADVDSTVARLWAIDLVVGLAVLTLLGGLGYALVRRSLRPLAAVETTAAAIAGGDLSRRVPDAGDRTEVGRLAGALNAMLARIEAAFAAQRSSEAWARASEERMRRFVADASHELRTPLTSIRGFAELHRQGAVAAPGAIERVMGRIEGEATRMGLLVEDLLLLARLDQARPLERRPVDLLTLAADAVHDAQPLAPGHVLRLEAAGSDGGPPPVVLGDEARLRQVVANLVSNAVTHTPPGTEVTVRVSSTTDSAVLVVADTGPGLSPADADRVFERFYRADQSRGRAAGGGSGLGLSIVAALVQAHGGTVGLDTAVGAGARFTVRLPAFEGPGGEAPAVAGGQGRTTVSPGAAG